MIYFICGAIVGAWGVLIFLGHKALKQHNKDVEAALQPAIKKKKRKTRVK